MRFYRRKRSFGFSRRSYPSRWNRPNKFRLKRIGRPSRPAPRLNILDRYGRIKDPHARYGIPKIDRMAREAQRNMGHTLERLRKMNKPWLP
jgi:hypothetical protein